MQAVVAHKRFLMVLHPLLRKAINQYYPDDDSKSGARRLAETFRTMLKQFKQGQIGSAKRKFSNATAKPNSRIAALLEKQARMRFDESLIPSSGTLIVIPSVLMEHWQVRFFVFVCFALGPASSSSVSHHHFILAVSDTN